MRMSKKKPFCGVLLSNAQHVNRVKTTAKYKRGLIYVKQTVSSCLVVGLIPLDVLHEDGRYE